MNRRNSHTEDLVLFVIALVALFGFAYFAMAQVDHWIAKVGGF